MDLNVYNSIVKFIPDTRKTPIPIKNKKYAPQLEIEENKLFLGSAWYINCYIYEVIDMDSYYAYIKFLNGEKAPDILHNGLDFYLCEGPKRVASCKIIEVSKIPFNM